MASTESDQHQSEPSNELRWGPRAAADAVASGGDFKDGEETDPQQPEIQEPEPLSLMKSEEVLVLPKEGQSKRQKADQKRIAEEFRMIKRPLLINAFDRRHEHDIPANLIMVSSSVQSEGKTFVSLNLAASMTMELDSWVLLIDGDVAKPGLSRRLGLGSTPGLIEHLDEGFDLGTLIQKTDIPKLSILPAGQRHKQSTELLASGAMRRLLHEVATRYPDRIVLFDSPPVLATSEAPVLSSLMGQIVIVVEHEATPQGLVKETVAQLGRTDNVYMLLNKCKSSLLSGKYGYQYGYGYGYGYSGDYGSEKND
ncbi:MAG TPA: chromosome partitioning ATPase [Chromatiaceae bacterium]|nr:chromosome partitioning ATPase [Chromatiaceae bacterium]